MFAPYQMNNIIITGHSNLLDAVINELHMLKILHIVEHSKNELADIGKPLESANKLSEILVRVRALATALNIKKEEIKFELKSGIDIESAAKKLNEEVSKNLEELRKIEETIAKNEALSRELEILKDINVPLEAFSSYKTIVHFAGYVKTKEITSALIQEISKATKKFMLFDSSTKKRCFLLLFADAKKKDVISNILENAGFSQVSFPNISNLNGNASSNLRKLEDETIKLQQRRAEAKKRLERIGRENKDFLISSEEFLTEQLEKAEAPLKFAATPSSFLVKGWVPNDELKNSIESLTKATHNKIFIHFEPAKKHDKVPVKLKNPIYAKPFEFFIDLYSMPAYREIDPTFFIFLTFPIFFGIMLGDVGYGALSLLFFWLLKKKMPKARNFSNILILASFVTILFGLLFGEFFGYEFIRPIVSREHEMFKLLFISIAIGIVHVNIGLIVGFINEFRSHGFMHALYAKGSWIVLQIGIALLALSYFGTVSTPPLVGAAFLGLSILMLFKGEGVKGLIELPSILTNIMSYARLMAIGLSSVILAVIINEQSAEFFHKGGFFVLIGVFILVFGHAINIMLGLLGSFLHSLRLHYVEFFSKFFHGGAQKYKPFGLKN
ncbi:V-type ATP synthase subunit I [Candidatus Woesearchaeota archaeon]|nr:V-type ATP synthase subunit I [Candidatus Woesearchaeota archaeon]